MEASASRPTVGVTGADAAAAAATLRDAGFATAVGTPAAVMDDDAAIYCALGTDALTGLAAAGRPPAPILVVDGPRGTPTVPRSALPAAARRLAAAFAGDADATATGAAERSDPSDGLRGEPSPGSPADLRRRRVPVLSLTVGDRTERAILECSLLATPIGMSEFAIVTGAEGVPVGGGNDGGGNDDGRDAGGAGVPVDQFRADGVVVATAAGSQGYAGDAGGPALGPDVPAASVVPIAPFTVDRERTVVRPPLAVRVLRAENEVTMVADGRRVGPVAPDEPVRIAADGELELLVTPHARPHFRRAGRLEKT